MSWHNFELSGCSVSKFESFICYLCKSTPSRDDIGRYDVTRMKHQNERMLRGGATLGAPQSAQREILDVSHQSVRKPVVTT